MKGNSVDIKGFKSKSNFKNINGIPLYELFHRNSELNVLNSYSFSKGISNAISDKSFIDECFSINSLYENSETIILPKPDSKLLKLNLFDTINKRRSVRNFSEEAITIEELSTILFYSSGVTGEYEATEDQHSMYLYAYPSAGGLMPLDLYILIKNVENIDQGIYYYNPIKHCLKSIQNFSLKSDLPIVTLCENLSKQAALSIYILGSMYLTGYKYGDRGYKFMLLEAGHVAQNFYLTSTAIGVGAVASGGFLDEEILELLGLEESENFVLYELIIGKPNLNTDYRFSP